MHPELFNKKQGKRDKKQSNNRRWNESGKK